MTRLTVSILLIAEIAVTLLVLDTFAKDIPAAPADRPCIALDLTLYTYDGPIVIDGACVDFISSIQSPPSLRVIAHDNGDGIFHNGFEE